MRRRGSARRLFFLASALALGLLVLSVPPLAQEEHDPALSVPADFEGEIQELLIQYAAELRSEVAPTIEDLLRSTSDRVRVVVCADDDEGIQAFRKDLLRWRISNPGRFRFVKTDRALTVWARDRMIVLQGDSGPAIVVPAPERNNGDEGRETDCRVPELLQRTDRKLRIRTSKLAVEGGNLISDEKRLFIGFPVIDDNLYEEGGERWKSREEILRGLQRRYGKPAVLIGDAETLLPNPHVDMYLTPIGGKKVLLGDPGLALRLLDGTPLGDVDPRDWEFAEDVAKGLDRIAAGLRKSGYHVVRLPMIVSNDEASPWVTYNNVVMEERDGSRFVYMPAYGIPVLDRAGRSVWESEGFRVRPIRSREISRFGGAVRCVTNVLRRTRSRPAPKSD